MITDEIIALRSALERLSLSDADKQTLREPLDRLTAQLVATEPALAPDGLGNPFKLLVDLQETPKDAEQRYSDAMRVFQLRAVQLRTAAEISGRIAAIRDPHDLMTFVVTTLAKRFGFYHVTLLLLDASRTALVPQAVNDPVFQPLITDRASVPLDGPGMICWAATHRQACLAPDVAANPYYLPYPLMQRTRAEIALPLIAADRLLGVLDLQSELLETFDDGEVQTLQSLANQVATALDNAHLFEAEQNQRRIADTLRDINLVISTLAQDDVLDLILEQIGRVLPYDAAAIWLLDEYSGGYRLAASEGYERFGVADALANVIISQDAKLLSDELVFNKKLITIPDVHADPRWVTIPGFEWIRSWAAVRISIRGKPIGQLLLDHAQIGFYSAQHEPILDALAIQISIAVENAQLLEAERHQRTIAETLREISIVLTGTLDQSDVLRRILEQVGRVLPFSAASVWRDHGDGLWRYAAGVGYGQFGIADQLAKFKFKRVGDAYIGAFDLPGGPLMISDMYKIRGYKVIPGFEWLRSFASAPIQVRGEVIGLLTLHHIQPNFYGAQHEPILEALATQISVAVENANLFEAERRQREIADALREISTVITGTLDPQTVLQRILEQVGRVVPYNAAGIWLYDAAGHYRIAMGVGYEQFGLDYKTWQIAVSTSTDWVARRVREDRKVITIPDTRREPRWIVYPGYEWIKSWAAAPIMGQHGVLGTLSLDSIRPNTYGPDAEPILQALATQLSIALNNARLYTALQESERRSKAMLDAIPDLMFRFSASGEILAVSTGSENEWSLSQERVLGKTIADIMPAALVEPIQAQLSDTLHSGETRVAEYRIMLRDQPRDYEARMVVSGQDEALSIVRNVTDRKRAEAELVKTLAELKRSNDELGQFAYVASHDLQEPLRMIASYVQLLSRRYKGKLDTDADEFIAFAVDGAHRMQRLINDLLAYSRVNTQAKPFELTDVEQTLQDALDNLQIALEDTKAEITHNPLPKVMADPVQLTGVFQNLIGNAVKFHGKETPRVHISAQPDAEFWQFSVKDNGIGIAPEYNDRIFVIFKRLHTAAEYPGTGIGLSICKKVIERHGGRIWVESAVGQGATFYFTLPVLKDERP